MKLSISELRSVTCHGLTQCYLPPHANEHTAALGLTPAREAIVAYLIYLPVPQSRRAESSSLFIEAFDNVLILNTVTHRQLGFQILVLCC